MSPPGGMPPGGVPPGPGQFAGPPPPGRPSLGLFSSPSAIRAGLLNLSGFGAGYFYLKQWPFFAAALIVTGGLLMTAALMGAADSLWVWLPIFLLWFAVAGTHGLFAGRGKDERALTRGEQLPRGPLPVLTAGGLAVALVLIFAGVWQTGEWQLRVAHAAHEDGHCMRAIDAYERVENGFQLSFSPSLMQRARDGAAACALLDRAQQDVDNGDYEQALDSYAGYFEHPAAIWEDTDGEIAEIHFDFAANLAEEGEYSQAQEIYAIIPVDYEGTPAADRVPEALTDLYNTGTASYGTGDYCAAVDEIDVFTDMEWDAAPDVVDRIESERPDAVLNCGWDSLDQGAPEDAEEMHDLLVADYPDHEADEVEELERYIGAGYVEQYMEELIAVGESELELFVSDEAGSDDTVTLSFDNDSPHEMALLYVGPDGTHGEVYADPCDDCEVYPEAPTVEESCNGDTTNLEVELDPGEYRLVIGFPGEGGVLHNTLDLSGGEVYEDCFYLING